RRLDRRLRRIHYPVRPDACTGPEVAPGGRPQCPSRTTTPRSETPDDHSKFGPAAARKPAETVSSAEKFRRVAEIPHRARQDLAGPGRRGAREEVRRLSLRSRFGRKSPYRHVR